METLTITNFEHFSLGGVDTLTIKISKQIFFLARGGCFKVTICKSFYHLSKRPFRGRFGTGRLHSELRDWGDKVKIRL